MTQSEALEMLRPFEPRLKSLGATSLFLFGSTARGQASSRSDLDLFVDYDPVSRFNLFDLLRAKYMIEDDLGVPVDIATSGGLHPRLKARIEQEAVQVV